MAKKGRREPLVRLAVAQSEVEARIWQEILRQEGITALIRNVDALSISYVAAPSPYSYELWVLAREASRARELLGLPEAGD